MDVAHGITWRKSMHDTLHEAYDQYLNEEYQASDGNGPLIPIILS